MVFFLTIYTGNRFFAFSVFMATFTAPFNRHFTAQVRLPWQAILEWPKRWQRKHCKWFRMVSVFNWTGRVCKSNITIIYFVGSFLSSFSQLFVVQPIHVDRSGFLVTHLQKHTLNLIQISQHVSLEAMCE